MDQNRRRKRLPSVSFRLDEASASAFDDLVAELPPMRGRYAQLLRQLVLDAYRSGDLELEGAASFRSGPRTDDRPLLTREVTFHLDSETAEALEQLEALLPETVVRGRTSVLMRHLILNAHEAKTNNPRRG